MPDIKAQGMPRDAVTLSPWASNMSADQTHYTERICELGGRRRDGRSQTVHLLFRIWAESEQVAINHQRPTCQPLNAVWIRSCRDSQASRLTVAP